MDLLQHADSFCCVLSHFDFSEYDLGMGKQRDGPGSDFSDLTPCFTYLAENF